MKITYSALALLLVLLACSKNEFETKPKISIKSVSSEFIPLGGSLGVRLEFKDKEGDVDDSLIVIRERLNMNSFAPPYQLKYDIPEFPDKSKGEFEVLLPYATGLVLGLNPIDIPGSDKNENDTLRLKFVVKDRAKNVSDTAIIDRIIVSRNITP
ncbi:hypothetical protein OCK74_15560 [Chitinophagaceae bacterium LB-8]|uniref:DUF1735 domain-containing protein n=1 Tax=Paraflavisolibacter caeni TaxID=2982496 RepID=A0A9X3B8C4_9BACT|nr:hypothetical protein [Paraflavisolibacter caeni]MCU7550535.1 hypothetical protein [Paraflavisolibacter caeni]